MIIYLIIRIDLKRLEAKLDRIISSFNLSHDGIPVFGFNGNGSRDIEPWFFVGDAKNQGPGSIFFRG